MNKSYLFFEQIYNISRKEQNGPDNLLKRPYSVKARVIGYEKTTRKN